MSQKLEIGEMTLKDIIDELSKPGRDPRDEMPKPILQFWCIKIWRFEGRYGIKWNSRNVIDLVLLLILE